MNKKAEYVLLSVILLLAFGARFAFWSEGVYGADLFYHYTIVEQSLEKGFIDVRNDLSVCYEGVTAHQPIGYYAIPYFGAKVIGLDAAFSIIPLLFGLLSLIAAYYLMKSLFKRKVALFAIFFAAISLAHVSRSYPFTYRGDNIIYPFLMLSLLLLYKSLTSKDNRSGRKFAIAAGAVSALSSLFWSGYPLVILVYFACLFLFLMFEYIKKKDISKSCKAAGWSIITQAIVLSILFYFVSFSGKALLFAKEYYPLIVLGSLGLLFCLSFAQKKKTHWPIIAYSGLIIIASLFMLDKIRTVLGGFGSVHSVINVVYEMQATSLYQFYFIFSFLLLFSIIGVFFLFKKFSREGAFFLGLLIPSLYLVLSASRFVYIAAIPLITLASLCLDNKKIIGKKFDIFVFIAILLCISMIGWMFYAFPLYFDTRIHEDITDAYLFLKENSPEDACIVSFSNYGAITEFIAKRHYYAASLGIGHPRAKEMYAFFLSENKSTFNPKNTFIVVANEDLRFIEGMKSTVDRPDLHYDIGVVQLYNNTLIAPPSELTFHIKEEENKKKVVKVVDGKFEELGSYFKDGEMFYNVGGKDCLYAMQKNFIYFEEGLCRSNLYRMVTRQKIDGLELVYTNNHTAIYRQLPSAS